MGSSSSTMGCSESKGVQRISVSASERKAGDVVTLQELDVTNLTSAESSASSGLAARGSPGAGSQSNVPLLKMKQDEADEDIDMIGDIKVLENIPISDLGESLDCRRSRAPWLPSPPTEYSGPITTQQLPPNSSSASSRDSADSGIYDLDEDYSFVITENSPAELIKRVEDEFCYVENLDLTITGKQCPRMLSGYQKARADEESILEGLRAEGFLASSRQKSNGGVSFDIIEATPQTQSAGSSQFQPKDFLPESHKNHLDRVRDRFTLHNRSSADVNRKLHLADERRKDALEAKTDKMLEISKHRQGRPKPEEVLKEKQTRKIDQAMEKREAHLKELRDKLHAKNQKVQQVKLKKLVNGPPVPVPVAVGTAFPSMNSYDNFFD
ncbi:unnamed protein product [Meganyctiphanes norvegica]|uniref:Uncharacterized protein n=1 Tax=Meganyctiphanes norvegica TaxID=48144 RepID=A0AAV2Q3M5_MEGNR